jgi:dihydropyrimidinase
VGENVETHDASGLLVLPGGVDVHTHLDWDFGVALTVDTFGTGTQAAAFGGTTTVIDFCNQTVMSRGTPRPMKIEFSR